MCKTWLSKWFNSMLWENFMNGFYHICTMYIYTHIYVILSVCYIVVAKLKIWPQLLNVRFGEWNSFGTEYICISNEENILRVKSSYVSDTSTGTSTSHIIAQMLMGLSKMRYLNHQRSECFHSICEYMFWKLKSNRAFRKRLIVNWFKRVCVCLCKHHISWAKFVISC